MLKMQGFRAKRDKTAKGLKKKNVERNTKQTKWVLRTKAQKKTKAAKKGKKNKKQKGLQGKIKRRGWLTFSYCRTVKEKQLI